MHVNAGSPGIEHQRISSSLLCSDRPAALIGSHLGIGPSSDLFRLRSLDPDAGVIREKVLLDPVLNQDAKLFQRIELSCRSVGQRLKDRLLDTLPGQPRQATMTVLFADGV